ncbi:MAG: hypothetical protein LKF53_07490 [Solobacterium sp.]|jgi:hypothetical protein|nr:hypothetical protein [Solobacterium sp.]MCH4206218.1 hypothetical protein [Solobacterium sp.]MCH4227684.1 hypothetical protein [Solobacterium sp.]MCH4283111.1 hypothetical protein [Solobacterium sp.]
MMEMKAKYWLTSALVLMAFSYTADGYQAAAVLFSLFAILTAAEAHSYAYLYHRAKDIILYGIIAALLTVCTGLVHRMPAVWFVSFCSVLCYVLFEENSSRAIRHTAAAMRIVMAALYAMTLLLPYSAYGVIDTLLLITFAFMPMQISCLRQWIAVHQRKSKIRVEVRTELY